jgi:putative hydrolase of the HAD superfamily
VLRAVVFDVDFTLARPGPDLGPDGYRQLGLRYGLDLDPTRYGEARVAAIRELKRHPELDHDEQVWVLFTERIMIGMGGEGDTRRAATEMERRWVRSEHFELYDDTLPVLEFLRTRGILIGLLSNSSRNLEEFVAHHGLLADAVLTSHVHGKTKPHETIFRALLARLDVAPGEAAMVGDTVEDDVEGALAIGMRAVLVDREGRYPAVAGRLDDLRGLPAALGLV